LAHLGRVVALAVATFVVSACKGQPDKTPWCSAAPQVDAEGDGGTKTARVIAPTYFRDAKPIVDAKCIRCHTEGGIGPFSLERWDDLFRRKDEIRHAVATRHMPPWHAARCCSDYHADASLTEDELATFVRFLDDGAPIGDAREAKTVPPMGGLSRVDVTAEMPLPYTPVPPQGKTDENRCFLLPWPLDRDGFVTGMNPVPGARSIVHHLVLGVLEGDGLDQAREIDGGDGRPGFDCNKLRGMGLRDLTVLGGSLIGSDYPDGLGRKVPARSVLLLNVHYSIANAPAIPDQTKIQFRIDETARDFRGMAIANLAWLVGEGMTIPAGEKDAVFFYEYSPTLFTRNKPVGLRSVSPHMHAFGSKIVVRVIHEDGSRECLLEIPHWHFGWEQPFWFAKPKRFEPGDHLYVECHFDNSAENQPNANPPRDIAWGGDNQDMCAAFVSFTDGEP